MAYEDDPYHDEDGEPLMDPDMGSEPKEEDWERSDHPRQSWILENEDFSAGKLRGKEGSSNKIKPKEERVQKLLIDVEQFDWNNNLQKVIMFLSRSEEETTANRKLAKELVDKWEFTYVTKYRGKSLLIYFND
ncbi:hypothetical protein AMTR_s00010p00260670 [Amborella trichopoda]|uniref:TFIIS N-terminal domain-containing protein n=1 Tax=Amborella trichopoda TaxID=13333 RepID=W1NG53_AMBTC|nr:hypothetical protein AMTR_s00010p00260670 [Amborella trichopoda]